jgi:hypothetical protein
MIDMKLLVNFTLVFLVLIINKKIHSEEIDVSTRLGLETRGFTQSTKDEFEANGIVSSVFFEPEIKWRNDDRSHRFSFLGFSRYDHQDSERTHSDLREFYWSYTKGKWTTLVGINKVFWGVTESVHLVDIINQTDLVEDIDQEAKLGQAMINFSTQQEWGKMDLYILPYFRERTFPGLNGRFNLGLKLAEDGMFESKQEKRNLDFALRYSHYFGDVDFGLHVFNGTNREPRFEANEEFNELIAIYDQTTQVGIEFQYTHDAWLWKFESIYRDTNIDSFFAGVAGFEFTLFQINQSAADLGLLLEYQYDDRNERSAPTSANNDLFLASRFAFNDSKDTSLLAGVVVDTETNSTFFNIEGQRRIGVNLNAELRIRALTNVDPKDLTYSFENDDYVELKLSWYY